MKVYNEPAFDHKDGTPLRAVLEKDGSLSDGYAYGNSSVNTTEAEAEGNLGLIRLALTKTTWGSLFLTDYHEVYLSVNEAEQILKELKRAIWDAEDTLKAHKKQQQKQTEVK